MRDLQTLARETREFMIEDPSRTWSYFFSSIAVWVLCIAGTLEGPIWFRACFSIATGFLTVRIFIFYHDFLHGAVFRNSPAARYIMWAYGVLILAPPNVWKRSHNYHHQHNAQMATASIGSYPVYTLKQYAECDWLEKLMYRIARHPLTMLFGYLFIFIIGMLLRSMFTDPKRHWDSFVSLAFHFVMLSTLVYFFGWEISIMSFLLPLGVACALGSYLFYIQHNVPGVEFRPRSEWTYMFAALRSSSFMEANPVLHWLTGNIGYHHVHHLNAQIPFYRLPDAMAAIPELQDPIRTNLTPKEIYRCLSLKLWDPDLQKMVPFPNRWYLTDLVPQRQEAMS